MAGPSAVMIVILGRTDQSHRRFGGNAGRQCTAMAVGSICLAEVRALETWTGDFIEEVLETGNYIYGESVERLRRLGKYYEAFLAPYEVGAGEVMKGNHRINYRIIDEDCVNGTMRQTCSCMDAMSYELSDGVRVFFSKYDSGIFTVYPYSYSIMKTGGAFWIFNSHATNINGLQVEVGQAALIRFENLNMMVHHLRKLCGSCEVQYTVAPVVVEVMDVSGSSTELGCREKSCGKKSVTEGGIHGLNNVPKVPNDYCGGACPSNLTGESCGIKKVTQVDQECLNNRRINKKRKMCSKLAIARAKKRSLRISSVSGDEVNISEDLIAVGVRNVENESDQRTSDASLSGVQEMNENVTGNGGEISVSKDLLEVDVFNGENESDQRSIGVALSLVQQVNENATNDGGEIRVSEDLVEMGVANDENVCDESSSGVASSFVEHGDKNVPNNEYEKRKMGNRIRSQKRRENNVGYRKRNLENVKNKRRKQSLENEMVFKRKNLANVRRRLDCDPVYKAKNLENVRNRLENDPAYKAKNLENVRNRLENDPAYKAKNLENARINFRNRLENDPVYRGKSVERATALTKVKRMNDDSKKMQNEAQNRSKEKKRSKKGEWGNLRDAYKLSIKEGPTHVCVCCGQLFFQKSVCKKKEYSKIRAVCTDEMWGAGHREICLTCLRYISKGKTPPLALINGLGFGSIPMPLLGLTPLEERLVSARLLFIKLRELGVDRQYGLQGHCVNVAVDLKDTVCVLPRLPSESDTIMVEIKRRMSDPKAYIRENIRAEKVHRAAEYLVGTELYKKHNITLRENWKSLYQNEIEMQSENLSCAGIDDEDEGWEEAVPLEEEAMEMEETLLTAAFLPSQGVSLAPGEGKVPLSLTGDADVDALAFPCVYGGQGREFAVPLTPVQIAKAEARSCDRRVATNVAKLMLSFCKARSYKLSSRLSIALRKKKCRRRITAKDAVDSVVIDSLVDHDEGFKILDVDRASPAYWDGKQKFVMAMLRQLGWPTFFLTLSAAETKWLELLVILSKVLDKKDITEEEAKQLTWQQKIRLLKSDPVTCARYFDHKFKEMWKLVTHKNGIFAPYEVENFYVRYEMQFRGSIHAHCFVWLKDAPVFDAATSGNKEQCENFIDSFITCEKNDSLGDVMFRQYHKHRKNCQRKRKGKIIGCRFDYPRVPMKSTQILLPLDESVSKNDAKEYRAIYKTILAQVDQCGREDEKCSFDAFLSRLGITEETYILSIRSSLRGKHPKVFLKRNVDERCINAYNKKILELWEANMDLQFILNPFATIKYVNSYLTKSKKGMSGLLRRIQDEVRRGNDELSMRLRKVVNAFLNNSEISAQEVCLHLLSIPMSMSSVGEVFINTAPPEERVRVLKSKGELEVMNDVEPESEDIFTEGLIEHYINRPSELQSVCLADFASMYTFHKSSARKVSEMELDSDVDLGLSDVEKNGESNCTGSNKRSKKLFLRNGSGFVTARKNRKIIRYRRYGADSDEYNFYREQLMLFVPWRKEYSLQDDVKRLYEESLKMISKGRKRYCKFEHEFEDVESDAESLDENDSEDEGRCIADLAIFDLNESEADIATDMTVLQKKQNAGKRSDLFTLPKLMLEDEYYELVSKLNEKQKLFLLDFMFKIKTMPDEQWFIFVCGAAGVGKSVLISALTQSLSRYWMHLMGNSADDLHVLLCAPTGKAAFNIGGVTIHNAFSFGFNLDKELCVNRKLSADIKNTLRCKYQKLKVIIVDEVSMVGSKMLHSINRILQDIFDSTDPFGGISMLVFGDMNQLQPVKDSWVFEVPSNIPGGLLGPYLWSNFVLFELDEIMRQKDDKLFAAALSNLAVGRTTDEENMMFKSRELEALNMSITDCMDKGIIAIYYQNADVDLYNEVYLSRMLTTGASCEAIDRCVGPGSEEYKCSILENFRIRHHKKTQNLLTNLSLKIDARYVIALNIDVKDGLANGTPCILKHISYGILKRDGSTVVSTLYVDFENDNIGANQRKTFQKKTMRSNVQINWTPIERVVKVIDVAAGSVMKVWRSQFPLKPAQSQTIHTAQGSTLQNALVSVEGLQRRLLYTAFSRVTSLSNLYIDGTFKPPCKANFTKDKVLVEIQRMRDECPYNFSLSFPDRSDTLEHFNFLYHNIRSLNKKLRYVQRDATYVNCDVVFLIETRTKNVSEVSLNDFDIIYRKDGCLGLPHAYGALVYVRSALVDKVTIFYHEYSCERTSSDKNSCMLVIGLLVQNTERPTGIIGIYRSPSFPKTRFYGIMSDAISEGTKICSGDLVVVGDFNINYAENSKGKQDLRNFMLSYDLQIRSSELVVTTDTGSILDLCFSTKPLMSCSVLESVISDHKPLFFSIQ